MICSQTCVIYAVISFRDVIVSRGKGPTPPRVWHLEKGIHPDWLGHQLMADVLSFDWALQEQTLQDMSSPSQPEQSFRIPKHLAFSSTESRAMMNCKQRLTDLGGIVGTAIFKPTHVDPSWRYVSNGTKSGWEFDLAVHELNWICRVSGQPFITVPVVLLGVTVATALVIEVAKDEFMAICPSCRFWC